MDHVTPARRSEMMRGIRSANTAPERIVRSVLHALGLRFRLHKKGLPGKPDIVLSRHNTVVFVHGCFWHRHGCKRTTVPKSKPEFWREKFIANVSRDARNVADLEALGWRVLVIWECETRDTNDLRKKLARAFGISTSGGRS